MTINFLSRNANTLREFSAETAAYAAERPDDFWLRVAAKNQADAAQSAMRELSLAYSEEAGELINLRFMGPRANGTLPLDSFLKIANPLSKAWAAAADRIRHGAVTSRISNDISDLLNLKLAGMGSGSTKIYVTGSGSTDLSGANLLHETLSQTFRMLNAKNSEFYDAVDAIGSKAAIHFGDMMKAINACGLAAEFSWYESSNLSVWTGTSDEIIRIKTLLDAVAQPQTYSETLAGSLSAITDTGRLEIRTAEGKVGIRYPLALTEIVQNLSIAKHTTFSVQTTKYFDSVAKKDVFKRILLGTPDNLNIE